MSEQKEFAELKSQIARLLFDLHTPLSEPDRQICWLLLEELLRKFYDLNQRQ
jgi:hypothetical protein